MRRYQFAVVVLVSLVSVFSTVTPSAADTRVVVTRGHPVPAVTVTAGRGGEALLTLTAAAPGVSWAVAGRESAVLSVDVDGRYAGDLVVMSPRPTPRGVALGRLAPGRHRVSFRLAADGGSVVVLTDLGVSVAAPRTMDATVRRHAPVLIGRALPAFGGPTQNARTDTPLLAWHEVWDGPLPGQRRITYSVVWSNEDGGTTGPALMARWGRTTDIEWTYSVVVDAAGRRVDGQAFYQGADHQTLPFTGRYEQDHPVLQTCTTNNNLCEVVAGTMRFALPVDDSRPGGRAREYLMDLHPWTYRVMAEEMIREGGVETPSDPATPSMGDQRTYLYVELDKSTGPGRRPGGGPGVAVLVRLRGDPTVYRSDHGYPSWSISRDDPAATTVELPAGVRRGDVERIEVARVAGGDDNGATVTVTDLNRGFLLDRAWLPGPSFAAVHSATVHLDAEAPTATLWSRAT
ncbi:MAG: hypothetical protein JWN54_3712 [Mycobacterium sp.]|nr:hypothetical protein [Mycobacterium sp.]